MGFFEAFGGLAIALLGAGLAATGGQFSMTAAYCHAPAREISVYDYSQIIFSTLLGFLFLGELPDVYSVIGYVIIVAMAVLMFFYNNHKGIFKNRKYCSLKYRTLRREICKYVFAYFGKNKV